MKPSLLTNTVLISLASHMAVLSMVSLSLRPALTATKMPSCVFWGNILGGRSAQPKAETHDTPAVAATGFTENPKEQMLRSVLPDGRLPVQAETGREGSFTPRQAIASYQIKPFADTKLFARKASFIPPSVTGQPLPVKKDTGIMLHPLLPYQLQLYFKDRQAVHIELMFSITPHKDKNTIQVKRKISSGNLEADLLSARYINHYLFIQQARFSPNSWQTVKIDLSK